MVTLQYIEYSHINLITFRLIPLLTQLQLSLSLSLPLSLPPSPSLPLHLTWICTHPPTSTHITTPLTHQLIEGNMWPSTRIHEPPGCRGNSGKPYISTNDKIAEEEPSRDEGVLDVARGLVHDVDVWGVEAEGSGRESVSDKVHPEELDGNESLRETKGGSQEDTGEVECE